MDTDIDYPEPEPYPYFGLPTPEPIIEEIEMPKKAQEPEKCLQCGSDNLYLDRLDKKEWGYDASILGDREFVKHFTRITCLSCNHSFDRYE